MLLDILEKRVAPAGGVSAGALPYSPVQYCILAAGTAVAWVYAVEINITILLTFKRRNGLYFWSLLISSWGIVLHALGFILKFLVGVNWIMACTIIDLGWVPMVTGVSMFSEWFHTQFRRDNECCMPQGSIPKE